MLDYLKKEADITFTENGAVTYVSTGSDCLDLFSTAGALRNARECDIINRFLRAYTEDPDMAMKLLFFVRDIRGGLGERRFFKAVLRWLAFNESQSVVKNIKYIPEYGRWDDIFALVGTPCEDDAVAFLHAQLSADLNVLNNSGQISLLAKWLPSVNTSNTNTVNLAKHLAKLFKMSEAVYRKNLSALRKHLKLAENYLRESDYTFDYSKLPSKALFKYRMAFLRNDSERYGEYLENVAKGIANMNSSVLMPYDIVRSCMNEELRFCSAYMKPMSQEEIKAVDVTWNNLPDYGNGKNMIAVVDNSFSMYSFSNPVPATVALSLGLYFAERNAGKFANHFITFSRTPKLIEIKGDNFYDRLRYVQSFSEMANTNLEAVFMLILNTAVKHKVPLSELPETIVIISDMEFDCALVNSDVTNFENAKEQFKKCGYTLPKVIFWNVASRNRQQPVTMNEQGAALVSGCSPILFKYIAGDEISPLKMMNEILLSERYKDILA